MADRLRRWRPDTAGPLTWLLAACAGWALLAWLGALLGMGGAVAPVVAAQAGPLPQPRPPAPDRIGPLAQYAEAASRPLFTRDRRPRGFLATAPDAGGEAEPQTLDLVLTGVLISPQVRLAIVQPSGGGEPQRVREGSAPDGAAGWRLVQVEPRRAIFEGGGGQAILELRTYGEAGAPAPARIEPAPAAPMDDAREAQAAAEAAADAAEPAQPDAARIEDIRRRIEARRAQLRAAGQNATPQATPRN